RCRLSAQIPTLVHWSAIGWFCPSAVIQLGAEQDWVSGTWSFAVSLARAAWGLVRESGSAVLYWRSSSGSIEVFTFQVRIIRCLPSDVTRPAKHGRGPLPVCTCKHDHPRHDTASIASPGGARLVEGVQQCRAFQRTAAAR